MSITQLGYFGLEVTDLGAWRSFVGDLGCQVRSDSPEDQLLVRIDERHHRLQVALAQHDCLAYFGLEVPDEAELSVVRDRLDAAGFQTRAGSAQECSERHVQQLLHGTDPVGSQIEFYTGPTVDRELFVSPVGIERFVTGGLGVGHLVIATPLMEEMIDFYVGVLGFRVSDRITEGPLDAVFLHCNPRHHTLALIRSSEEAPRSEFHHFMLEVPTLDHVGRALDRCTRAGATVSFSLGRHTNDGMVSFYLQTPSGFHVEYGTDGRLIDEDSWDVVRYESTSFWGHEYLLAKA